VRSKTGATTIIIDELSRQIYSGQIQ